MLKCSCSLKENRASEPLTIAVNDVYFIAVPALFTVARFPAVPAPWSELGGQFLCMMIGPIV